MPLGWSVQRSEQPCTKESLAMFGAALVTPERAVFVGAAEQVDLPGSEGDLGILTGHAPLITTLRPGIVRVIASGRDERFVVLGGIAEFSRSELTVLAETAVPAAERDTIN